MEILIIFPVILQTVINLIMVSGQTFCTKFNKIEFGLKLKLISPKVRVFLFN